MSDNLSLTIAGKSFSFTPRYVEGHTLSAIEAAVLNRTLAENIGNNFRQKVKDAEASPTGFDADEMQKSFDEYASTYEFGVRHTTGGGTRRSPLEAEINRLATDAVKNAIRARGLKNVAKEAIEAKVAEILADEDKRAKLETIAKGNLDALAAVAGTDAEAPAEESIVADVESGPSKPRGKRSKAAATEAA